MAAFFLHVLKIILGVGLYTNYIILGLDIKLLCLLDNLTDYFAHKSNII